MLKEEIVRKYKDEERLLVARFLDKVELAEKSNNIKTTDFLNLKEQNLISKITNQIKIDAFFYGGFEEAERKMLYIIPDELKDYKKDIDYNDYISVIRINISNKITNKYNHRIYLGALMKLGLKREKIGDILIDDDGADLIVSKEISGFLYTNLQSLKRFEGCTVEEIKLEKIKKVKQNIENKIIQVSSMRLDNIIAELARTSRRKSSDIITSERVFVNYVCETKNTKLVKESDLITIRGKGRFKICDIIGNTKKGKINIKIEIFS